MGLLSISSILNISARLCSNKTVPTVMKYLNVAEKNDAAKNIAAILSRGASQRVGRKSINRNRFISSFSARKLLPVQ
jgi:hypothetical protein